MDDTLHALPEIDSLQELFLKLKERLGCAGLYIAPDKLQYTEHFQYLGNRVTRTTIKPQKVQICRDSNKTLNDLQKLLGDSNWIWPKLGIPTYSLSHYSIKRQSGT